MIGSTNKRHFSLPIVFIARRSNNSGRMEKSSNVQSSDEEILGVSIREPVSRSVGHAILIVNAA